MHAWAHHSFLHTEAVYHGCTIALQLLYDKRNYLGCSPYLWCVRAGCPKLFIEGNDWERCSGEVFRIYRKEGPGPVRVGDTVGIYYTPRGRWFGCSGPFCQARAGCPGIPTQSHGFNNPHLWLRCSGEVFEIYARGKSVGSLISPHDTVMLRFVRDNKWVGLVNKHPEKLSCPGATRPPPPDKYEACWGSVFELWVRPLDWLEHYHLILLLHVVLGCSCNEVLVDVHLVIWVYIIWIVQEHTLQIMYIHSTRSDYLCTH